MRLRPFFKFIFSSPSSSFVQGLPLETRVESLGSFSRRLSVEDLGISVVVDRIVSGISLYNAFIALPASTDLATVSGVCVTGCAKCLGQKVVGPFDPTEQINVVNPPLPEGCTVTDQDAAGGVAGDDDDDDDDDACALSRR